MKQKLLKEYVKTIVELHWMTGAGIPKIVSNTIDALLGHDKTRYKNLMSRTRIKKEFLDNLDLDKKVRKEIEDALDRGHKRTAQKLLTKALKEKNIEIEEGSLTEVLGDFSMSGLRRMEAPGSFRAGRQVTGSRSSLQNDVEREGADTNDAAVVFVKNGDKYLAVSRQNDFGNLNMPGGHIEVGEAPIDAAAREVQEETGLKVSGLNPLFVDDRGGKKVHVFQAGEFSGDLQSSHEGLASWEPEENMMNGQYCDTFKRAMKICR